MLEQLLAFLSQGFLLRDTEYQQIQAAIPVLVRNRAAEVRAQVMRSEPMNPTQMVGDVAVIDVIGVLSKQPIVMRLFGLEDRPTLPEIEQAVDSAARDSKVRGVIIRFDTPGGTVAGTEAVGNAIARCAGAKTTIGLVTDRCMSGGYWLASQCTKIISNATADVGSIGAIFGMYTYGGMLEELGMKAEVARSVPLKAPGTLGEDLNDAQRQDLNRWISGKHDEFVKVVARGRGVSDADVRSKWATAQVWSGSQALTLGLIDAVGGIDEAMAALNAAGAPGVRGGAAAQVNTVADGRPKHGELTMGKKLMACLATLGLAANASEAEAWNFYNALTGDERSRADAVKTAEDAELAAAAQGGPATEPQQTPAQASAAQQATPAASPAAPNPPTPAAQVPTAGIDRSVIQELASTAGMSGEQLDSFVTLHSIGQTPEREVRQQLVAFMQQDMPPIGVSRTTAGDDGRESLAAAIEDVMTERMGGEVEERHARASEIEHLSNVEIGRRFLAGLGVPGASSMHPEQIAECLFDRMRLAGTVGSVALSHSTSDFGGVLGASANKTLVIGYQDEETTYQVWTQPDTLPNLLPHTEYNVSGVPRPPRVLEGQEYGLTTIAENGEVKQVYKYGHIVPLTLEMFINDTLGAFSESILDFGGASRQLRNYIAYQALVNPPVVKEDGLSFFNAAHNNLNQGGAAALATDPLSAMRTGMRQQKGLDPGNGGTKRNLAIRATFLLVPVELEDTAEVLVSSRFKIGGTNNEPNKRFLNSLTPISDPELSDASATAYYLTGPKRQAPVKSLTLRGYERPTIKRMNNSRTDGIEFQLRDFAGAAAVKYRSAQKNDGA